MRLYQLLTENILKKLREQLDPFTIAQIDWNIPEPHFQQWAAQIYVNCKPGRCPEWASILDAIDYYREKIKDNRFQEILKKYTPSPKNILSLSLDQIKTAQSEFDAKYNAPSKRSLKRANKQNYTTTLYNTTDLKIIKIEKTDETDGAAQILSDYARETMWCVTDVKTGDQYLDKGPLYLIITPKQKYLYSPSADQFMDEEDEPASDKLDRKLSRKIEAIIPEFALEWRSPNTTDIDEYEQLLLKYGTPIKLAYYVANNQYRFNERWLEAEPKIIQDIDAIRIYLRYMRTRWPEVEPILLADSEKSKTGNQALVYYAANNIHGRWPKAEQIIIRDPWATLFYISEILKGREWPEGEKAIIASGDQKAIKSLHELKHKML